MDLSSATILQLAEKIRSRELSPTELVRHFLDRVEKLNPRVNAFVTVAGELALRDAQLAESEVVEGHYRGPLHGIPVAIKDICYTKAMPTTASSLILREFVPDDNATVVSRLRQAGAIVIGKTQTHEFAYGPSTDSPHFGACRNPWDVDRITGGSSGGSACAVAARLSVAALGTDSGGSIRWPAHCCGVVGLKPTYGRVSRYGVIPLSWSLDHVGPITRTVRDAAYVLQAIAGHDPRDRTTAKVPVPDYISGLTESVKGLRLGIPSSHYYEALQPEVGKAVNKALGTLENLGAITLAIELPHIHLALGAELTIIFAEATSYHESYLRTHADQYGRDVRHNLDTGRFILATDYLRAQRVRTLVLQDFLQTLNQVDAIVTPTAPIIAPKLGQTTVDIEGRHESVLDAAWRFLYPSNVTGLPTISIPCGFSDGLPVGLQIIAKPFDEATLVRLGHAYESETDWHLRRPQAADLDR